MDPKTDVIRQQIDETRGSLTDKLETLEGQVKEGLRSVTSTVEHISDTVKTRVEETVDSVKRTFDLSGHVRRHPYGMTGGAMLLGAALGWAFGGRRRPGGTYYPVPAPMPHRAYEEPPHAAPHMAEESRPGVLSSLLQPVAAEFDQIKGAAIGAFLGLVRDAAVRSVPPSLAPKVEEILNNITRRAGGEVVSGKVLPPSDNGASEHEAARSYH